MPVAEKDNAVATAAKKTTVADATKEEEEQQVATTDGEEQAAQLAEGIVADESYQLTIILPREPGRVQVIASPREAIHDIKQSIIESPETCIYSCFYLSYKGVRLNDFMDLGEIEGVTPQSEFELIEDVYTERDARIHINRLRDLMAGPHKQSPNAIGIDAGLSFLTAVTGTVVEETIESPKDGEKAPETAFTGYDLKAPAALSKFVPVSFERHPPQCLKSLALSGWNSPPHYLRLRGELLYLVVTTLENETVHITSATTGFFVNRSTNNQFDPAPKPSTTDKPLRAHSLITLLQSVSAQFATQFTLLQKFITDHQMLEVLPVNTYPPAHPWAVTRTPHTYDPTRPADSYLNFGTDTVDSLHDWNDELQSHRELPRGDLQERVLRERLINKIQADFADAAVRGAIQVVAGAVVPLNPTDPPESYMYLYNNIFFSKGSDGRGTFEALGGDEAAHVATGKDLEGVKTLNGADIEGLYTLGSVIVDYKGVRVVAQSIVPGIFRRQDENSIIYGSVDNGTVISADPKFHELVGQAAKSLHLAEHSVFDAEGKKVNLYTSVETKGLLGADGRRYLLDLYRLHPVDVEFQEAECVATEGEGEGKGATPAYPHKMTLLRPELMDLFWDSKFRAWVKEKATALAEKKAKATEAEKKEGETKVVENGTANEEKKEGEEKPAQLSTEEQVAAEDAASLDFDLTFNPDAFIGVKAVEEEDLEKLHQQEGVVREASKFLRETIIPALIIDFTSYIVSPLDGEALTKIMHRRGINMRYLGRVASLVASTEDKRLAHIKDLAVQEMIIRASKRILRGLLNTAAITQVAECTSHFLNCLLGTAYNPAPEGVVSEPLKAPAYASLTPASLADQIRFEVLRRFRYALPDCYIGSIKKLPMLREICLRVGLQVEARDYQFVPSAVEEEEETAVEEPKEGGKSKKDKKKGQAVKQKKIKRITTFVPEDVMNLLPTVKQATTRATHLDYRFQSLFAEEAFEAGKMSLAQGQRQLGLELLLESLALHEQTYGFLHPETAKCYAALAMIYYHGEDGEAALDFQRRAVIASERTSGVDNPDTIHNYLNLGLFEHAAGRTQLALRFLRHAMNYWDLVFGPGHPDAATADNNVAVMLQILRDYDLSCKFFERACETQESILGKEHVVTATSYHILAKAFSLTGDFKKALAVEKIAYRVFDEKLGRDDIRTRESESWLKELTQNAVYTVRQTGIRAPEAGQGERARLNTEVAGAGNRPHGIQGSSADRRANEVHW
ncbi:clustered mitochondria-domain-containing protein [Jimgerdemannia flammicorona]|uniref:Clustered mitochondria protein homolog n=1 Tax=Jimgerdemannia flammicorona TaxID=994334 RepID=A0A433QTY8_9FUNG|nr:clustered mitochondria-domain-containing protein [Jimgerdemannia flammicorona]